jgi:hypothetical protein
MQKKINGLNAEWHRQHKMPKNPTVQQRIDWHLAHLENCGCRPRLTGKAERANEEAEDQDTHGGMMRYS